MPKMGSDVKTMVIYGPGGCGKTFHSLRLASHFDIPRVIDAWSPEREIVKGALHLTCEPLENPPAHVEQLSFAEACLRAGINL